MVIVDDAVVASLVVYVQEGRVEDHLLYAVNLYDGVLLAIVTHDDLVVVTVTVVTSVAGTA